MASKVNRIPSLIEKNLREQDKFLEKFKSKILSIELEHKQTDDVIQLMKDLVAEQKKCIVSLLRNTSTKPDKIVEDVLDHCFKSLKMIDSRYKR